MPHLPLSRLSIHGTIELPAVAVAVMDTPQFQRLREIKVRNEA